MQFRLSSLWSVSYNSLVCLCKSGFEPFGQICSVKTTTFMSNLRPEYWAKEMFKRGSFIHVVPHLPSFHFHITSQRGEMKSNEFLGNSRYNLYFILFLSQWKSKLKWATLGSLEQSRQLTETRAIRAPWLTLPEATSWGGLGCSDCICEISSPTAVTAIKKPYACTSSSCKAIADPSLYVHFHQRFKPECPHQTMNEPFLLSAPPQQC